MATRSSYITATTTAQDVVLDGPGAGVAVINLDGGGFIAWRFDGTTAAAADENNMVPAQAGAPDMSQFGPGGSVYAQQVPESARQDLSAYRNGGSVYAQQVPQQ